MTEAFETWQKIREPGDHVECGGDEVLQELQDSLHKTMPKRWRQAPSSSVSRRDRRGLETLRLLRVERQERTHMVLSDVGLQGEGLDDSIKLRSTRAARTSTESTLGGSGKIAKHRGVASKTQSARAKPRGRRGGNYDANNEAEQRSPHKSIHCKIHGTRAWLVSGATASRLAAVMRASAATCVNNPKTTGHHTEEGTRTVCCSCCEPQLPPIRDMMRHTTTQLTSEKHARPGER